MTDSCVKMRTAFLLFQSEDYNLLIIGVPNVGKSSLINLLRRVNLKKAKKATRVAPEAGVTRSVLEKIKVLFPFVYTERQRPRRVNAVMKLVIQLSLKMI